MRRVGRPESWIWLDTTKKVAKGVVTKKFRQILNFILYRDIDLPRGPPRLTGRRVPYLLCILLRNPYRHPSTILKLGSAAEGSFGVLYNI